MVSLTWFSYIKKTKKTNKQKNTQKKEENSIKVLVLITDFVSLPLLLVKLASKRGVRIKIT